MTERIELTVDADGIRVDRFLAERTELSRSAIQRLAREGHVTADGTAVDPSHKVRAGERLSLVVPPPEEPLSLEAEDIPIDVLYEDADVIVVNKPAGLVVHPGYGHRTGTLVNAVAGRVGAEAGRQAGRPGIVHRLDKDTSGVMIVAKSDTAHLALSRQLQAKAFTKEYLALVWGDPGERPVVIDAPIQRDDTDRRRMAIRQTGRDAITRFRRLATYGGGSSRAALLHVRPETGRTHQIRAHLAFARLPIVGDPVYGRTHEPSSLGRQWLHAWRLTVRLPRAGERTFVAPLSDDLRAVLADLGEPANETPLLREALA